MAAEWSLVRFLRRAKGILIARNLELPDNTRLDLLHGTSSWSRRNEDVQDTSVPNPYYCTYHVFFSASPEGCVPENALCIKTGFVPYYMRSIE